MADEENATKVLNTVYCSSNYCSSPILQEHDEAAKPVVVKLKRFVS